MNTLIEEITEEIKESPNTLESGNTNAVRFLEDSIRFGSRLDHLFSLADSEQPLFDTQEDLFHAYTLWRIRIGHTLVKSEFGTQKGLETKYPVLTETDGVRNPILPFLQPGIGAVMTNPNIRFGETDRDSGVSLASPEGIKQFKSAHTYLKHALETLALILRNETEKKIVLNVDVKNREIFVDKETKCHFSRIKTNRRFEYLMEIIKNKKVGGIKLADNTSLQTLSKSIAKINERVARDLDLTYDLIVNEQNSGYRINTDKYEIKVI